MARPVKLPKPLELGVYRAWVEEEFQHPRFTTQLAGLGELFSAAAGSACPPRDTVLNIVLHTGAEDRLFAVKSFARQSPWKDHWDRFRGTEAFRSFRAASFLRTAGVGAPQPAAVLERWEGGRLLQSYFVSGHETGSTSFKDALISIYRNHPYAEALMGLLQVVADGIRAMHDAGFFHGDLGNQNILVHQDGSFRWKRPVFVDLSRGRCLTEVSTRQRAFDFSRIHLPGDLLRIFKEMYFGQRPPADFDALEKAYRRRFSWHTSTRKFRHPVREKKRSIAIDEEQAYPDTRDIWIWDEKSAQAITIVRSHERNRLTPWSNHRKVIRGVARNSRKVWKTYHELRPNAFKTSVTMKNRIGISVDPRRETWTWESALLSGLGRIPVLIRFYHHESPAATQFRIRAALDIMKEGHPVAAALVQDRNAVINSTSWTRFVFSVLDGLGEDLDFVQVGHAPNRVKWGLWSYEEYYRLLDPAFRYAASNRHARLVGPSMIDFEYHHLLGLLEHLPDGASFWAMSHLLYVDRRGAPEARQGSFDVVNKCALARSILGNFGQLGNRLFVTEVNWPLLNTGIWSPVGSPYLFPGQMVGAPSVSEDVYADYMVRYLLQTICSGMVDRVYWWRLAARGYGLVDDGDPDQWRIRPAYDILRKFVEHMDDAEFTWLDEEDGKYIFSFNSPSRDNFSIAYCREGERLWQSQRAGKLFDSPGGRLEMETKEVVLTGSPKYFQDRMDLYGKGRSMGVTATQRVELSDD